MSNIIPLNLHTTESAGQVNAQSTPDSLDEQPAKFKNVICLKIDNLDVIGYTDKDISYNVIAFATIDLRYPASAVLSESGITMVPYFKFAPKSTATFNTNCIAAFVPQGQLPKDVKDLYRKFSAASSRKKGTGR